VPFRWYAAAARRRYLPTFSDGNVRSPLYGALALPPAKLLAANFRVVKHRYFVLRSWPTTRTRGMNMLRWALIFFVVALLAAVLGFTGIAAAAAGAAKVLFFLFVILFLITLLGHVARRP